MDNYRWWIRHHHDLEHFYIEPGILIYMTAKADSWPGLQLNFLSQMKQKNVEQ